MINALLKMVRFTASMMIFFASMAASADQALDTAKKECNDTISKYFDQCVIREKIDGGYRFIQCGDKRYASITVQSMLYPAHDGVPAHRECVENGHVARVDNLGQAFTRGSDFKIVTSFGTRKTLTADGRTTILGRDGVRLESNDFGRTFTKYDGQSVAALPRDTVNQFYAGRSLERTAAARETASIAIRAEGHVTDRSSAEAPIEYGSHLNRSK